MPEPTLIQRYAHRARHTGRRVAAATEEATNGRWFTLAVIAAVTLVTVACLAGGVWSAAALLGGE